MYTTDLEKNTDVLNSGWLSTALHMYQYNVLKHGIFLNET